MVNFVRENHDWQDCENKMQNWHDSEWFCSTRLTRRPISSTSREEMKLSIYSPADVTLHPTLARMISCLRCVPSAWKTTNEEIKILFHWANGGITDWSHLNTKVHMRQIKFSDSVNTPHNIVSVKYVPSVLTWPQMPCQGKGGITSDITSNVLPECPFIDRFHVTSLSSKMHN